MVMELWVLCSLPSHDLSKTFTPTFVSTILIAWNTPPTCIYMNAHSLLLYLCSEITFSKRTSLIPISCCIPLSCLKHLDSTYLGVLLCKYACLYILLLFLTYSIECRIHKIREFVCLFLILCPTLRTVLGIW